MSVSSGRIGRITVRQRPIKEGRQKVDVSLFIRHRGWLGKVPLFGLMHHLEFEILTEGGRGL